MKILYLYNVRYKNIRTLAMLFRCVKQSSHTTFSAWGRGDLPIHSNGTFPGCDSQNWPWVKMHL